MVRRILVVDGTADVVVSLTSIAGTMVGGLDMAMVDMRILPAEEPKPAFDLDIRLPREKPRRDWEQRRRMRRK